MWGSHSYEAAAGTAAAWASGSGEIIGVLAAAVAIGFVVTAMVVSLRLRRRPREGLTCAQAPPPYPEAGIAAEITAPGRVQRPEGDLEMEPGIGTALRAE